MDFSAYTDILIDSIASWLMVLSVAALFFLPGLVIYERKASQRKEKAEWKEIAGLGVCAFLIVLVIVLFNTIPAVIDIANENYVSVHGEYFTSHRTRDNVYAHVTTDDGEQLDLSTPFGGGVIQNDYVLLGEHQGTIWYAEKSKYILEYIPDETG